MRVVVTGASGNIGTALLHWLTDHPAIGSVVGIARHPPSGRTCPEYANTNWHAIDVGSLQAADRLAEAFEGAQSVVHLAWRITDDHDREQQRRTNRHGSAAVLDAVRRAGVGHLAFLSSAAVYSPAPSGARVREDWPRRGIPGSPYSADKVMVEDMLDHAEADLPGLRVTRIRPPAVVQTAAAQEVTAMTLGPLAGLPRLTGGRLPVLPLPSDARAQFVSAQDVADLVGRAVLAGARGAYNVADEPVLAPAELARLLGGRHLPTPGLVARTLLDLTFRLRLQPLNPSWFDVLRGVPLLDCAKARNELGWRGGEDARTLLTRMREAVAHGVGAPAPPL